MDSGSLIASWVAIGVAAFAGVLIPLITTRMRKKK